MFHTKLLDCTLRDGGYINDWNFGYQNIKSIIARLTKANVDVIECGFLEDGEYSKECSMFSAVDQIELLLPKEKGVTQYVAMTRYGYLDINNLKEYDGNSINGIRVTFHEDEAVEALEFCGKIQKKGYKVYVQPVGTTSYTDSYLLKLIDIVNKMKPYAFYIVDTLGLMRKNDLLRMFFLVDNNLNEDIVIGFHSHNNLQLSFSNSQELVDLHSRRTILLDSSVYGMGRGAGNLNTELIAQHINSVKEEIYNIEYLLEIIDESINPIMKTHTWGYSVPYYLAAINNCHPNYATYLMNRKSLPIKSISSILKNITQDKRELYNEKYIFDLYTQYQKHSVDDKADINKLKEILNNRNILIIAPGRSVKDQLQEIKDHIQSKEAFVITVNFDGDEISPDLCFFSNDKRFQRFRNTHVNAEDYNVILTSNIKLKQDSCKYIVNYSDYLNSLPLVNDNATLMLIALLIKLEIKGVEIAGFDGFKYSTYDNYAEGELETKLEVERVMEMNHQISRVVHEYSGKICFNFITKSLYQL
jgi:4-hydroxy 2-oxovalerate aldolase